MMPHRKSITSKYRDFKNKNVIGVVKNPQCYPREGGGGSDDHGGRGVGVRRGDSIIFDPPLPFNLKIYERPSGAMNIAYGVVFGTATEINQTLGHHCHHNI